MKEKTKKIVISKTSDHTYLINAWPNAIKTFDLGEIAKNKELKTLIIDCDEDINYYPTSEEHNRIKDLASLGVKIYWENRLKNEKWFYYKGLFMPKNLVKKFSEFMDIHKIASFYISARDLDKDHEIAVSNAIEGYKRFNGGKGIIITGGGGGGMKFCNRTAKEKKLISVGVCWDDNAEKQNDYLDAISKFASDDIIPRQEVIDKFSNIIFAGPGGFGTDLELAITNINTRQNLHPNRPVILVCKKAYDKYMDRMQDIIQRDRGGNIGEIIVRNTYLSIDGTDVYDILTNHYCNK